jgi:N-acetylglucosamine kinase-like BadF-type ATPase
MQSDSLVLGIDGGGSKTVCWLTSAEHGAPPTPLGRGLSGPANPQSVGWPAAVTELNRAVDGALADAGMPVAPLAAACVALAGGDRDSVRRPLEQWAAERRLAARFLATHDALPILAAGTPEGHGVALISGTGSFAFGRNAAGTFARAGGWGYLFGDEGSGYAIALAGLRAVAQAADGRGPQTQLTERLLAELQIDAPAKLVEAVYSNAADRRGLARLAALILETAERGDTVAVRIVASAANELADMVAAVVRSLALEREQYALALTGGVLIHSANLRSELAKCLATRQCAPGSVQSVPEPVSGAVHLARDLLRRMFAC